MKKGYPEEYPIHLVIDGQLMGVFLLTKSHLTDWAVGYLYSENIIASKEDIESLVVDEENSMIQVNLHNRFAMEAYHAKTKNYTSGFGRGVTVNSIDDAKQLTHINFHETRKYKLSGLLKARTQFTQNTPIYSETGGVHGCCLLIANQTIVVREDIGRHNSVDKVVGYAVNNDLEPEECVLMTTGRVSYEMVSKAAKCGFPIIVSRTAATLQSVLLAEELKIDLIGFLRGKAKNPIIYTSFGRVENDLEIYTLKEKA